MKTRILRCSICGNIIMFNEDSGVSPTCCGQKMEELKESQVDSDKEKHLPCVKMDYKEYKTSCSGEAFSHKNDCKSTITVKIGEAPHPMIDDHYIQWIVLETSCGMHTRFFDPEGTAEHTFCLSACETPIAVYAYCNVHGLWKYTPGAVDVKKRDCADR